MGELGWFDFILSADIVQCLGGDDAGCRHEAGSVTADVGVVWCRVYGDVVFYEFGAEDVEVHGIAKRVECFVRVFDSEFVDGWVCDTGVLDGDVKMGAMACSLMRW